MPCPDLTSSEGAYKKAAYLTGIPASLTVQCRNVWKACMQGIRHSRKQLPRMAISRNGPTQGV